MINLYLHKYIQDASLICRIILLYRISRFVPFRIRVVNLDPLFRIQIQMDRFIGFHWIPSLDYCPLSSQLFGLVCWITGCKGQVYSLARYKIFSSMDKKKQKFFIQLHQSRKKLDVKYLMIMCEIRLVTYHCYRFEWSLDGYVVESIEHQQH